MIGPYWMVVVNIILFLILGICMFFYKRFFPHKKINFLYLTIIISILPIVSIFRQGVYQSGDFTIQIYNAISFYDSLRDGIIIPSWAGSMNGYYGYPLFTFIYIIPYYLISILHFVGLTFILSEKLILAAAYVTSGIMMYLSLRKLTKNDFSAFSGSIIYLFAPYHLVDLHFRVALAETIAFSETSFIFYLYLRAEEEHKPIYFVLSSLLFGVLFLTHPPMFIFYSGIFIIFALYRAFYTRRLAIRDMLLFFATIIIGLAISSFAWIPRFTLTQFTYGAQLIQRTVSFVPFWQLIYSPWRDGFLFQGHYGELSYAIGYTQLAALFSAILFVLKTKKSKKIRIDLIFWLFITLSLIFLTLSYSKFIWDAFPVLNLMQFSYRFLHPIIFCISIITAYLVLSLKDSKKYVYVFLIITVAYTILNWGNRMMITGVNDTWLSNEVPNSTREIEGLYEGYPKWYSPVKPSYIPYNAKSPIEVVSGKAEISIDKHSSIDHEYMIDAKSKSTLLENTFYFPDWRIYVDGSETNINFQTKKFPGRMVFNTPAGKHRVSVIYSDIPIIKWAKRMSITIVAIEIAYILFYYLKSTYGKNKK